MKAPAFAAAALAFALLQTFAALAAATERAPVARGNTAAPARQPARRIVSLIPSLTEDLFAIGAGPQVVAVSQFTDYPPAAMQLPTVSSFSSIDTERVFALHPDAVVGIPAQAALVADLRRLGLQPLLIPDDSFDDIFAALRTLGALTGREAAAQALARRLKARTAALVRAVPAGSRPRVLVVLGVTPVFTVGNRSYIAHLLDLAGGVNAAADLPAAYGRYSAEAVVRDDPDVIVADKTSGLASVLGQAPWNLLRAVKQKHVYILEDPDILERPGPRYNDGLAWLIARLHR